MKKNFFLISYWINKTGNSPGIMADDIVESLLKLNCKLVILSSYDCMKIQKKNISHFRVPSISLSDFWVETKNISSAFDLFLFIVLLPCILTFGVFLDILEKLILKGKSGGKWTWSILASPVAIILSLTNRFDLIFSTGGPACAHLTGVILTFFTKKKLFSQLQDPLFGKDIGRSARSAKYLKLFEKLLLKRCYKLIFVTKSAAEESKIRNDSSKSKIFGIYTGAISQKISYSILKKNIDNKKKIHLTHLGTLYSSRNFKNLIKSIKNLSNRNLISLSNLRILNLGDIYGEELKKDCTKLYINWIASIDRHKALKKCLESDILLLIQHTDDRSKLTFPYKLYDYLNIGKIIFALTNNNELKNMLVKRGHICANVKDEKDISKNLLHLIKNNKNISNNILKLRHKYKISHLQQSKLMLEL